MTTLASEGGPFLDVAGAAKHLGVNTAFIRRLILERRIRYYKVGKFVRFRPADLDAFVEAGRVEPSRPHPVLGLNGISRPRAPRRAGITR